MTTTGLTSGTALAPPPLDTAPPTAGAGALDGRTRPPGRRRRRSPISVRFLLRRLVGSVIAVWGSLTLVFFALNMGGNPVAAMVDPNASQADVEAMTRLLGYDQPLVVQYATFLGNVATGTFPESLRYKKDSLQIVLETLPNTVILSGTGLLLAILLGLAVGYLAANGRTGLTRNGPLAAIVTLQALPPILLGVILVLVFALTLRWFPTGGAGGIDHLVLPTVALAIYGAPPIARIFRASILSTQGADHVRTAQAKGISPAMVRFRHVAANAMLPVVNLIGVQAGAMLSGAVVIETLFSWPGVGRLAINALMNRDYPLVLASITVVTIGFILVNLLVDVVSAVLDPRVRDQ